LILFRVLFKLVLKMILVSNKDLIKFGKVDNRQLLIRVSDYGDALIMRLWFKCRGMSK
jgi:hypothetical protein